MAQDKKIPGSACVPFEQDLVLYYYGELDGLERSKIDAHVAGCEPCRLYLKELASFLPVTVAADDPPQAFWDDYSRELRHKLTALQERRSWWESWLSPEPWRVSVLAGVAVVALALALTFGKGFWRSGEISQDEAFFMEALPVTENMEFFTNMEVLDSMDMLEFMSGQGSGAV